MTCRTLFALFSAAMSWFIPSQSRLFGQESSSGHIILAQAKQDATALTPDPETAAKDTESADEDSSVFQMQAKKPPAKNIKAKVPAKASQSKSLPKPKPKPAPKPTPRPVPPRNPVRTPTPYVDPRPTVIEPLTPAPNGRFQVPIPEEKGEFNIWGDDPKIQTPSSPGRHQLGLVGLVNFLGAGFGAEYLHRQTTWLDWGLNLSSTQAQLTKTTGIDANEFLNSSMANLKSFVRVFSSRRLYLGAGLNMSSIAGSFGWKGPGVVDEEISTDFKLQLALVDIFIGSEWELGKGFYFGVDWVGIGVPLIGNMSFEENIDLDDTTKILTGQTAEERILSELAAQFRPYYVLLKIGYTL